MFTDLAINLAASVIYDFGKSIQHWVSKKEMVYVALRQLGASPALHDFPDRYVEALVEFRFLDKGKAVLVFFREESIQQVFYDYYYGPEGKRGSDTALDEALHHCVDALRVGDAVREADVNVAAEIRQFWEVFRQKVQESRTVKEAELQQQLEAMRADGSDMKEALSRILRWVDTANKTAVEVEGETFRMDSETAPQKLQQYVEKRYNFGNIGTAHFHIHTSPGIVLERPTSPEKQTTPPANIQPVNLRTIRRDKSLRWHQRLFFGFLKKRTRQGHALRAQGIYDADERTVFLNNLHYFQPLDFKDEGRQSSRPFSDFFFQSLDEPKNDGSFYLLLGETGTGKSTALLELFTRYALAKRRYDIVFASFDKDLEAVFCLPNHEKTILFLDGIDEAPQMLLDPEAFFTQVENNARNFAKVIISCRTQFFVRKTEERSRTNTKPPKNYHKTYLDFLSIDAVRQYVGNYYEMGKPDYIAALSMVNQTGNLFRRPLLLSFIADMVEKRDAFLFFQVNPKSGSAVGLVTEYEIYETILNKWMEREESLNPNTEGDYSRMLFEVSMKLALTNFYPGGRKYVYYSDLKSIAEKYQLPINETLLRNRSLLRRNEQGYYNFAHRTFKEFFFAQLLYDGLIPEREFPFDDYEDAEKFYNLMGEVKYFQQPGDEERLKKHLPGRIAFPNDARLPRPVLVFCKLEGIPPSHDAWGIFSFFLSKAALEVEHFDCLTDIAEYLIQAECDSASEDHMRLESGRHGVEIGDLLQPFFFCQTGDSFHFIHRSFAEFLCLRKLFQVESPADTASHFPFHKLRFRHLFAEEIRWLQFLAYSNEVALSMDNYDVSVEDFQQSEAATWYEYFAQKASVSFHDFFPRLERADGRLCVRANQPADNGFLKHIPFAELVKELDLAHNNLQGEIPLENFTRLETLHIAGNPDLRLSTLPASLKRITLSKKEKGNIPAGLKGAILFKEDAVQRLAGSSNAVPEMVEVKGGRFWMGSGEDDENAKSDEKPRHLVEVSDFSIGRYALTVREFACFVKETGYVTKAEREGWAVASWWDGNTLTYFLRTGVDWTCEVYGQPMDGQFARHPVIFVSWHDAKAYCGWLCQKTGKTCRLPTEAQWEYAAIGGQQSGRRDEDGNIVREYEFAGGDEAEKVAWHFEKFRDSDTGHVNFRTRPVGKLKHNALGLYDMSGNVYEWCSDRYDSNYYEACDSKGVVENPGGSESGSDRVVRGGSWNSNSENCRTANRNNNSPDNRNNNIGFRLVSVP